MAAVFAQAVESISHQLEHDICSEYRFLKSKTSFVHILSTQMPHMACKKSLGSGIWISRVRKIELTPHSSTEFRYECNGYHGIIHKCIKMWCGVWGLELDGPDNCIRNFVYRGLISNCAKN